MKPNRPQYNTDWHQCVRCGCTFPERELEQGRRRDVVLAIDETIWVCREPTRCALYKAHRDGELAREREDADVVCAATALGGKR